MLACGVSAGSIATRTSRGPSSVHSVSVTSRAPRFTAPEVRLEEVGGAPVRLGRGHAGRLVGELLERARSAGDAGADRLAQPAAPLGEARSSSSAA